MCDHNRNLIGIESYCPFPIYILDEHNHCLFINHAARAFFNIPSTVFEADVEPLLTEYIPEQMLHYHQQVMRSGEKQVGRDKITCAGKSFKAWSCMIEVAPYYCEHHSLIGTISQWQQAQSRIEQVSKLLQERG